MNLVADTNVFLSVVLNETAKSTIIRMTTGASITAPEILPYEVGNALSAMIKRKKLAEPDALKALEAVNLIPVRLVAVDLQASLKIAADHGTYAYDAYFLQCAAGYSLPLLTQDKRMMRIAEKIGIQVIELE